MIESVEGIARWVFVLAAMGAFGSALFPIYARQPAPRQVLPIAALVVLVAALVVLATTVAGFDAGSFGETMQIVLFQSPFGPAWLVRLAAAVVLVVVVLAGGGEVSVLALASIILCTEAWMGHAAALGFGYCVVTCIHLLAGGAWLGGLAPLALTMRKDGDAALLGRFSAMGMVSIVAIVASGAFEAWSILQRAPDLSVPYDQLLAGKVGLLLLLVGLAAVNRLALMPRLGNGANLPRLRATVALEQGLGLAIVFVAITLGATNPHP